MSKLDDVAIPIIDRLNDCARFAIQSEIGPKDYLACVIAHTLYVMSMHGDKALDVAAWFRREYDDALSDPQFVENARLAEIRRIEMDAERRGVIPFKRRPVL